GDGTYYSVPGSGDLFTVGSFDGQLSLGIATFSEWQADGFPAPSPATVKYLKYTWGPTVYQDATMDGLSFTRELDFGTWKALGYPVARTDALTADSSIRTYTGSDELFVWDAVALNDMVVIHKLTFAEYAHLGYPAVDDESEPAFRKLSWNPNIVGPIGQSGEIGVVDFATWDFFARPTPQIVKSF
uniref:hypothetical protein n=1 Tax=Clavibacter michiganensis TaxID=28447 RepID=UPI0005B918EF